MKKNLVFLTLVLLTLACNIGYTQEPSARDLVASLAQIPGLVESPNKGVFVDLVKAIDEEYPGKIKIEVYPFPRSVANVMEGRADFHIPVPRNPDINNSKLPYKFVTEKLANVTFVIYSHQDKIITRKSINDVLAKGGKFPYLIEVTSGTESLFPFPTTGFYGFANSSLQKVQNKRVDALICEASADENLKQLKLKAIRRSFYGNMEDAIMIPKGPKGDQLDRTLSDCIKKLKASGRLQEIFKNVHPPYIEWQPAEMGW